MHRRGALPSADTLARAFAIGAEAMGETDVLRRDPAGVLDGHAVFRTRWFVFYALMCAHTPWHIAGPACGVGRDVTRADMGQFFRMAWWRWDLAEQLTAHFLEAQA